jgi:sec-independent protein translocase protein TatA
MFGDLGDSPWKIAIIAVVIIVLFGSKKLPHAARSLGQSMRILKREVQGLHEDDDAAPAQIDALQQQIRDLQRAAAMDPVASAEAPRTQQPG